MVEKILKKYLLRSPLDAWLPFQQPTHLMQLAKKNNEKENSVFLMFPKVKCDLTYLTLNSNRLSFRISVYFLLILLGEFAFQWKRFSFDYTHSNLS